MTAFTSVTLPFLIRIAEGGQTMKQESEFPTEYIELQIAARNIADCSLLVYYATDEAAQQRHKIELAHHIKRIKKILEELKCQG